MIIGMKMLGRSLLSSTLVKGSKTEYETKKMVSVALYWLGVMPNSVVRPSILALPIFVLLGISLQISVRARGTNRSRNEAR